MLAAAGSTAPLFAELMIGALLLLLQPLQPASVKIIAAESAAGTIKVRVKIFMGLSSLQPYIWLSLHTVQMPTFIPAAVRCADFQ
jgi:hypothetical protein